MSINVTHFFFVEREREKHLMKNVHKCQTRCMFCEWNILFDCHFKQQITIITTVEGRINDIYTQRVTIMLTKQCELAFFAVVT